MSEQIPVGFIMLKSNERDSEGSPVYLNALAIDCIGTSRYALDGSAVYTRDGRSMDVKETLAEISRKILIAQMRVRQIPVSE